MMRQQSIFIFILALISGFVKTCQAEIIGYWKFNDYPGSDLIFPQKCESIIPVQSD